MVLNSKRFGKFREQQNKRGREIGAGTCSPDDRGTMKRTGSSKRQPPGKKALGVRFATLVRLREGVWVAE